jgi:hypothetical protein
MSADIHAKLLLKIALSQILQTIGFRTAQSTALDILLEILERYIHLITRSARDFAEFANRTQPTFDDLACSFHKHRINVSDLEEYISWVDTPEFVLARQLQLNTGNPTLFVRLTGKQRSVRSAREHLGYCDDPENKELAERESDEEFEYVDEYFPLMTRPSVAGGEEEAVAVVEVEEAAAAAAEEKSSEGQAVDERGLAQENQETDVTKQGVV